ncbi:MAG: SRPBCC family protein [Sphingomonadaceae bacterium]|nr:SRPBCC family protein [Sphingomonadaceae bacterium]
MTDTITKTVQIAVPIAKVWDALTDHTKFGAWFQVALDQPFIVGKPSTGHMTYPGFEHFPWASRTVAIEPMEYFAFEWPATGGDEDAIRNGVPEWTLVEFRLQPADGGTRLTVTESGFDKVPEPRRTNVMRSNDGGWAEQMQNIRRYVEG